MNLRVTGFHITPCIIVETKSIVIVIADGYSFPLCVARNMGACMAIARTTIAIMVDRDPVVDFKKYTFIHLPMVTSFCSVGPSHRRNLRQAVVSVGGSSAAASGASFWPFGNSWPFGNGNVFGTSGAATSSGSGSSAAAAAASGELEIHGFIQLNA